MLLRYLSNVDARRLALWSALLWYVTMVLRYGESDSGLWLRSPGVGIIVGAILTINAVPAGGKLRGLGFWPVFRFFLIPFCVSSYSAFIKGHSFFLIFPTNARDNAAAGGLIVALWGVVWFARCLRVPPDKPPAKAPFKSTMQDS